ncbi:MAG TPA: TetR/AcrR family transcriptional regulator [Myxococcaceae bacterium]|nr:TetR/AcrR family transcriptional regulator [Myxococcaceae bacterium]
MERTLGTKRWERRKEARPAEIVAAALQLFSNRGFAATRLEDVATVAGVSKGTVYLYFESKEQLFEAVVREAIAPNIDRAEAIVEAFEGPTPELLRRLFDLLGAALETPLTGVMKLLVAESGNFPQLARLYADLVLRRAFRLLERILERGIARGEFRPVDPRTTVPLVMAPVMLLGMWKHSFGAHTDLVLDRRAVLEAHRDNLLRGLAAAPGGQS